MIHLITGGSGSGKSSYGENWIRERARGNLPLLYLATMIPYGDEGKRRVERHRKLRQGKGFFTIECPGKLTGLNFPPNRGILLECVSNLVANTWYEERKGYLSEEEVVEKVKEDLLFLRENTPLLAVITNDTSRDLPSASPEMQAYQRMLGEINGYLGSIAEEVTEVVVGIPIPIKRDERP